MLRQVRRDFQGTVNIAIDESSEIVDRITTKEIYCALRESINGKVARSRDIFIELIKNSPPCIIQYLTLSLTHAHLKRQRSQKNQNWCITSN